MADCSTDDVAPTTGTASTNKEERAEPTKREEKHEKKANHDDKKSNGNETVPITIDLTHANAMNFDTYIFVYGQTKHNADNKFIGVRSFLGANGDWIEMESKNIQQYLKKTQGIPYYDFTVNCKESPLYDATTQKFTFEMTEPFGAGRIVIIYKDNASAPKGRGFDQHDWWVGTPDGINLTTPDPTNPSTFGFYVLYDKLEYTFINHTFFVNTTSVDFLGIPMKLTYSKSTDTDTRGIDESTARVQFIKSLQNTTGSQDPTSPKTQEFEWQSLVFYSDGKKTGDSPTTGGNGPTGGSVLRILSPAKGAVLGQTRQSVLNMGKYDTGAKPHEYSKPFLPLNTFWDDVIDSIWSVDGSKPTQFIATIGDADKPDAQVQYTGTFDEKTGDLSFSNKTDPNSPYVVEKPYDMYVDWKYNGETYDNVVFDTSRSVMVWGADGIFLDNSGKGHADGPIKTALGACINRGLVKSKTMNSYYSSPGHWYVSGNSEYCNYYAYWLHYFAIPNDVKTDNGQTNPIYALSYDDYMSNPSPLIQPNVSDGGSIVITLSMVSDWTDGTKS